MVKRSVEDATSVTRQTFPLPIDGLHSDNTGTCYMPSEGYTSFVTQTHKYNNDLKA